MGVSVHKRRPKRTTTRSAKNDPINPNHYKKGGLEVIDIIEAFDLDFRTGNAIKYILRHRDKGRPREDLEKSIWYIQRAIKRLPLQKKKVS